MILVAEMRDTAAIAGYVYAGLEPMSWKELRDAAGFIHDVAVAPEARRHGIAAALLEAAADWLREQGAPRVMLWTAEPNVEAQRLFADRSAGSRPRECRSRTRVKRRNRRGPRVAAIRKTRVVPRAAARVVVPAKALREQTRFPAANRMVCVPVASTPVTP